MTLLYSTIKGKQYIKTVSKSRGRKHHQNVVLLSYERAGSRLECPAEGLILHNVIVTLFTALNWAVNQAPSESLPPLPGQRGRRGEGRIGLLRGSNDRGP